MTEIDIVRRAFIVSTHVLANLEFYRVVVLGPVVGSHRHDQRFECGGVTVARVFDQIGRKGGYAAFSWWES